MHDNIELWILEKIKSNPQIFGGYLSNPSIMLQYLKDFHPDVAKNLNIQMMSTLSTISRTKNKLLKKHPFLDKRRPHQLSFEELNT